MVVFGLDRPFPNKNREFAVVPSSTSGIGTDIRINVLARRTATRKVVIMLVKLQICATCEVGLPVCLRSKASLDITGIVGFTEPLCSGLLFGIAGPKQSRFQTRLQACPRTSWLDYQPAH